jgi:hypothetical protein
VDNGGDTHYIARHINSFAGPADRGLKKRRATRARHVRIVHVVTQRNAMPS